MAPERGAASVPSTLVVFEDAPDPTELIAGLAQQLGEVDVRRPRTLGREPAAGRPIIIAILPAVPSDALLLDLVAWQARDDEPSMLLGCAPAGPPELSERALASGFDDFVAGRGSARELAVRARALLRRAAARKISSPELLQHGAVSLDRRSNEVFLPGGRRIHLTAMEAALLAALLAASGHTVSRAELLDRVWGEHALEIGIRSVDNLMARLRRKLGDPEVIVTVRGVGFRVD